MKQLTEKQQKIADYIKERLQKEGRPPTFREIQEAFSFHSLSSVHFHIKALERKGVLKSERYLARSLTLNQKIDEGTLPLKGAISAFGSIDKRKAEERIKTPQGFVPHPERSFLFEVSDSSFIEEGLLEGDFLIVELKEGIQEGSTYLLRAGGATFIRKVYQEEENLILVSRNESLTAMILPRRSVEIEGALVASFRRY